MFISVILRSKRISRSQALEAIRAINRQLSEDFEPYWGFGAQLRLEGTSPDVINVGTPATDMRGDAVLYVVDNQADSDDALGYHESNFNGVPYGFVLLELCRKLKESWQVTLSHEALELVADPQANLLVKGPHPTVPSREVYFWFEVCDAVQQDTYKIDGVPVSNFVLPLYFSQDSTAAARIDFLGIDKGGALKPFSVRPAGYVGYYDPQSNQDEQFFADRRAQTRARLKAKANIGRGQFRRRAQGAENRTQFMLRAMQADAPARVAKLRTLAFAGAASGLAGAPPTDPFRHVVLLALENRSFDHMLGDFARINPACDGIVTPPRSNSNAGGTAFNQAANSTMTFPKGIDPKHELENVAAQMSTLATPMSGFVTDFEAAYKRELKGRVMTTAVGQVMGYFPFGAAQGSDSLPALHTLARNFVVCDRWFSSVPGPTWTNRFFLLTGTSLGWVTMPSMSHPTRLFRNYSQPTIFDRLETARKRWRIYKDGIPNSIVLSSMHRFLDRYENMDRFESDCAGDESAFPEFSFIEPRYFGADENSQHPPSDVMAGERLIARVYEKLRANRALWESTLLIVTYDEHGGFYDHVRPVPATPPDAHKDEYAFDQYGVRVPTILVSPWFDASILKQEYDHTSVLKYLDQKWNLSPLGLGARADNARNFAGDWKLRTSPRPDTPPTLGVRPPSRARRMAAAPLDNDASQVEGSRGALLMYVEQCLPGTGPTSATPVKGKHAARKLAAPPAPTPRTRVASAEAKTDALFAKASAPPAAAPATPKRVLRRKAAKPAKKRSKSRRPR